MKSTSTNALDKVESDNWLNAHYDPMASIFCSTECMTLCNITPDGENRLVTASLGFPATKEMKLKVFTSTRLVHESSILDIPTSLVSVYLDQTTPRTPAIAVASGPCVFVYKNMRPFFKFTLPSLSLNPVEENAWNEAVKGNATLSNLRDTLDLLREEGAQLTARSFRFLQLPPEEVSDFFESYKTSPLKKQTVTSCMGTLPKSHSEQDAVSCLVVGTESQQLYVVDPEAFTILAGMILPSVPVFLHITGVYDVEFRILVACRNGVIYQLKRGVKSPGKGIEPGAHILGLTRINKNIYVGCGDDTLQCFSPKARRLWTLTMPASIMTMKHIQSVSRNVNLLAIALADSTVRLYRDKHLVDTIPTEDVVTGIVFGNYGHEEGTLLMCTRGGGLIVKLLKRAADFDKSAEVTRGPPAAQFQKLDIPRKTKLFVDQTMRERENAVAMHRQFMQDLYRLRLKTARSYLDVLQTRISPLSTDPKEPMKLNATVQGMGPNFKLVVALQNASAQNAITNVFVTFSFDPAFYRIENPYIPVPYLVPGLTYNLSTLVYALNDKGVSDEIKVYVMRPKKETPIIVGVINMPVSEGILLD